MYLPESQLQKQYPKYSAYAFTHTEDFPMELLQLQYFQAIAKTQNISAAAKELHIAQPSLSQALKRLEQETGVPLFDRIGKHVRLNTYGRIFLKYTEEVFSALDNASLEIQSFRGQDDKTVHLSILAASMLLPDIYRKIQAADPDIRLHIRQNDQKHFPHKKEFILSSDWKLPDNMSSCRVLLEEDIQLALPASHPLAKQPAIRLNDLTGNPFLSLSPGSSLSRILNHYFAISNYQPDVITYIDNPDIMRKLLTAHAGLAFIPVRTWKGFSHGNVVLRPIENLAMKRFLLLSWKADSFLTPSMLLCRDVITDYFSQ